MPWRVRWSLSARWREGDSVGTLTRVKAEKGRRCSCGSVAPVVDAEYIRGELPRQLPAGISWKHACPACGAEFSIQPVLSLVAFQVGLVVLIGKLIVDGVETEDRVTGRAFLFGALAFIAWLVRLAWITADRVRVRRRYPQLKT